MSELASFSIKIKNLKCFGESEQGFDQIKLINLIIGRNNSGKSALLDLVEYAISGKMEAPESYWHDGQTPKIIAGAPLLERELKFVFPKGTHGGTIPGNNHWEFGAKLVGALLTWDIGAVRDHKYISIGDSLGGNRPLDSIKNADIYYQKMAESKENPLSRKVFKLISAERNISPEGDNNTNLQVSSDGRGATNIVQAFLNKAKLRSDLVEVSLLEDLRKIFSGDADFTDIVCQQHDNSTWEIYLEEKKKGRIPLSQSGSGLKTIILVLIHIHLLPVVDNQALSDYVFGFEELENNLHPALLRRLLSYLREIALEKNCLFFLTTHSNVEIDLFSKDPLAQILHITHDGKQAIVQTAKTYIESKGILDDLDVRASDLLQSNGIIWVEGPSDRIYLNHWIELWSNGVLCEGNHYQCVFYGGRLLSHLSSKAPDLVDDSISIMLANRNFAIVIDSDKRNPQSRLNQTKKRIIAEVGDSEGFCWVTKGREIENYIPSGAIASLLDVQDIEQVGQYDDFFANLNGVSSGRGDHYIKNKPMLAEELKPHVTKELLKGVLGLGEKLDALCGTIRKWNSD